MALFMSDKCKYVYFIGYSADINKLWHQINFENPEILCEISLRPTCDCQVGRRDGWCCSRHTRLSPWSPDRHSNPPHRAPGGWSAGPPPDTEGSELGRSPQGRQGPEPAVGRPPSPHTCAPATQVPFQHKDRISSYGISIMKIRRSSNRLIFMMGSLYRYDGIFIWYDG